VTRPARSLAAGLGIQTVPITNCAVTLDETDETAIDALSKIRNRGKKVGSRSQRRSA
jgi:hypothetical protein